MIDIIIPVYNQFEYLKKCIDSIRRNTKNYHLIIIDDASTEDWAVDERPTVVNDKVKGFGFSCNKGFEISTSPMVCILNSDTIVTPGWLDTMIAVSDFADIIGPTTSHSNGIQCDHSITPRRHRLSIRDIESIGRLKEYAYGAIYEEADVFGFCMLIKKSVINEIGGFDYQRYQDGYYEDWDFVRRAQQLGFKSAWAKGAYVHHYGAMSFESRIGWNEIKKLSDRNEKLFKETENPVGKRDGELLPRRRVSDECFTR